MKFEATKRFAKDVESLRDADLLRRLGDVLTEIGAQPTLSTVSNVKSMKASRHHFRIRVGEYRLGCRIEGDTLVLARFLHRKDIYREFP